MDTTVLKKEKSPENNVLKTQSISKDWIMTTAVELREILKALFLAKYTVLFGHVSGQAKKCKDVLTGIAVRG
jgi:hypothetical protein